MKEQLEDPLCEILERHLYRASTEDQRSSEVIDAILTDYLGYLKTQGVHIPGPVKQVFMEDLKEEIREMIIKRTFGAIAPDLGTPSENPLRPRPPRKLA